MAGTIATTQPVIGGTSLVNVAEFIMEGGRLDEDTALRLLLLPDDRAADLMYAAHLVKRHFHGDSLHRCSIVNAKSGACGEDCKFCAQSSFYQPQTGVETYSLMNADAILRAADDAVTYGSSNFGIVTAIKGVTEGPMLDQICEAVRRIRARGRIAPDASLGVVSRRVLEKLKEAGLQVYHHNLETARSFYPRICTTRDWMENFETITTAKQVGLEACCGGILGMGESPQQRVELMLQVAQVAPEHIPLNFLVPVKGTPLEHLQPMKPIECLKAIAVFRLTNPRSDLFIAGGRVQHLRQLQPMLFFAGANGMMVGNYLTTPGRTKEDDLELVRDLGLNT
ncbi:MAG: biotin synthase BioB [Planctomycetes bacterium]|jgi:biotin synthase|nr:biotin synthase BioB [Planctomycetota bacterium]MCL4729965.1 biotin synthase BioB [Planctomycetota bacterium]